MSRVVPLVLLLLGTACNSGPAPGSSRKSEPAAALPTTVLSAPSALRKAGATRPEFLRGPTGGAAIAPFVASQVLRARGEDRKVLVYVGAPWCEPCKLFHDAVRRGELDGLLPGVRLVEFDLDADRDALTAAGYSSRLIPLFALPRDDGTSSEKRIEGSVKGEAAVQADLAPRLRLLIGGSSG